MPGSRTSDLSPRGEPDDRKALKKDIRDPDCKSACSLTRSEGSSRSSFSRYTCDTNDSKVRQAKRRTIGAAGCIAKDASCRTTWPDDEAKDRRTSQTGLATAVAEADMSSSSAVDRLRFMTGNEEDEEVVKREALEASSESVLPFLTIISLRRLL
eukprot:CAMPEP_0175078454 /NCGR_PEP_ID=MMETSP0052_2-20121109/24131_1 /TAXON_ID=51329 ORGANISM="Polytomella parva, Strain SAG 63-3" /NCGR_SAMPLE_ID=MMETSP0052_2 /ASSEMBLY_ACC=CAM_ASM_000194 /LENGTH=154 /DNA_ID=CAMNT_0016348385 /DNA_START=303 /DNA_END=767 /DNA_ORIENTATION=+